MFIYDTFYKKMKRKIITIEKYIISIIKLVAEAMIVKISSTEKMSVKLIIVIKKYTERCTKTILTQFFAN